MNINKKWSTLIGSILIHITLGSLLTFGNFSPYLTSYLRELTGSSIRYSNVIWIFSSNSILFGITSVIIGQIIAKFKPSLKLIIFLGCLIMSSGIALTYFTVQHSFLMTLFTYGCLNGISNGFTYSTCLSVTMKWFPETKGFSNTLILFGFGLGSAFFNPLITFFINPHNYSPDKSFGNATKNEQDEKYFSAANHLELLNRVPYAFLLTASIYFSIQLIGCLLIFEKNVAIPIDPEKDVKEPLKKQEQIVIVARNSLQVAYKDPNEGLTVGEVLKLPAFYLITFMIINYAYASGFILNYYKSFGQAFIENDSYLSIVGSTMSLAGAFGRLLWGFLADRLSFKFCYLIQTTIIVLLVTTIYFTQFISYHNEIFYLIWLFCIFFVSSGIWVNGPTVVMKCFGQKYFTSVYGLVLLINIPANFIPPLLSLLINIVGWFWFFAIGSFLTLTGWFLALFFTVKNENNKNI